MTKDLNDYNSGRDGNPFATGWGQVGYQQQQAAKEAARQRDKQQAQELDRIRGGGVASGRTNILVLAFLAGVFAIFGGKFGAPDDYRIWAGGGAIGTGIIAGFFWEPFCKLIRIAFVVAAIGGVLYLLLTGNQ